MKALLTQVLAAVAALVLSGTVTAAPALAAPPKPRKEQWWFGTWDITSKVWPVSQGEGITVAVLGRGVNAKIADLKGVVLPGGDVTGGTSDGRTDKDRELGGHGTGMAALIASHGAGTGTAGVAPRSRILPVVTAGGNGIDEAGKAGSGIRFAVDHGARVISMSFGIPSGEPGAECEMQGAVDYAIQRDVVLVASAGNAGDVYNKPEQPAVCKGVVAVGAVDSKQRPWESTQRQSYVSLAAPGADVGSVGRKGTFINNVSGTSQAAALTSATAALVRARHPQMPAREVVRRLTATAKDVGKRGWDNRSGYGMVRPYEALTADVPASARNPVYEKWNKYQKAKPPPAPPAKPSEAVSPDDGEDSGSPILFIVAGVVAAVLLATGSVILVMVRRYRRLDEDPCDTPYPSADDGGQIPQADGYGMPDRGPGGR